MGRKEGKTGQRVWNKLRQKERCVLPINNKDELCCSRALVTMREWCPRGQQGNHYENVRKGRRNADANGVQVTLMKRWRCPDYTTIR